ncbi:galactose oxidase [Punctularia strigosozonata HHB-11173 SS5]|uniref:galactose oxidase n=1 Tax=Punctularia strigosozonata (strain HHB-11173) TaxID=741275 RepID=UPI00044182B1|nr:galactose oxidase [Punctularia strigosozonata HHB-11173 SS5]EIN08195.1 galactose oxidase [Punctularia strigosozonata HHB-11173 SS5]
MAPLARWTLLTHAPTLARSSHGVCAVGPRIVVHGGELKPRTPTDDSSPGVVHTLDLTGFPAKGAGPADRYLHLKTFAAAQNGSAPSPRVGASIATAHGSVYLWGGRGGIDMSPLPRDAIGMYAGALSSSGVSWKPVGTPDDPHEPESRSYHASVAYKDEVYVHAGCPASGRLSALHAFSTASNTWRALAPAPEPGRGGTALVAATLSGQDVLLRFGGFAGHELPTPEHAGTLDLFHIATNTWRTLTPSPDAVHGFPGARSVHGFASFRAPALPGCVALLWHGEKAPSAAGHAGAGEFWDDVWALTFDPRPDADDIAAGLQWKKLDVAPGNNPEGRGWFPPASIPAIELGAPDGASSDVAVMFGGLLSSNERSGELWVLQVVDE